MQSITDIQKALQLVFKRHYTETVYLTNAHKNSKNIDIVGCTRAILHVLRDKIVSVLECLDDVTLNHVETKI